MQPKLLEANSDPFVYFVLSDFYEAEFAHMLSHWLSSEAQWQRAVHHFYDQFELNFKHVLAVPAPIFDALLGASALGQVKQLVEKLFKTQFRPRLAVSAHKLVNGQGIGIHADSAQQAESHRIVVQLSRNWQDDYGGNIVFFGSDNVTDVSKIFRPVFNTAVGFSLGGVSYHAVSDVSHSQRLTLLYGFWSVSSPFDESAEAGKTVAAE